MNRDQLVEKMHEAVKSAAWGHSIEAALDVVLAEVLKYKCATEEEGKAVRLHNIGVSMDCILAELFENRRAHYSAPREKTLQAKVGEIINPRWTPCPEREVAISEIVALLEEGGRK